jgi:translation initiation factor IF-2
MRVYELAKELGTPSKEIVELLKKKGADIKNHMSTIDETLAETVRKELAAPPKKVAKKKAAKPKKAEPKAAKPKAKAAPAKKAKPAPPKKAKPAPPKVVELVPPKEAKPAPPPPKAKPAPPPPPPVKEVAEVEAPPEPAPPPEVEKAPPVEPEDGRPGVKAINLTEAMTVKELSAALEVKTTDVIKKLMEIGIMLSVNQVVDLEVAKTITKKFGFELEVSSFELDEFAVLKEEVEETLADRPPVVTMMGHVDHGKTLLLDAIRKTRVAESEAGGITQHIGAYQISIPEKGKITFLDTPGHEAFTAMRARGAQVTDIVVLVVAADDGVMPQTREAITHAKDAGVPIVVAVNKIDKTNANPDRVRRQLVELEVVPDDWGGDTIFVEVSAKEEINLEELQEMILLQAEILELKSNPERSAKGVVIEAQLDRARGPVATVLIQQGTLRDGEAFVAGLYAGRVRAMFDDLGKKVSDASPARPVEVLGLSGVPSAGDSFVVVADERKARQVAILRQEKQRKEKLTRTARVTLEDLFDQIREGEVKELKIILRADVHGSAQALQESLEKLSTDEVRLTATSSSVGGITESDVMLAAASNAIIIGFNVRPSPQAAGLADKEKVDIRLYSVIYEILKDVRAAMEGLLEPTYKEAVLGRAEVREVFNIPRIGRIAGCYVTDGVLRRNVNARLLRDDIVVYEGKIASLKRFKDDAREVAKGYECGAGLENYQDVKIGDVIEPYTVEEVARKLEG